MGDNYYNILQVNRNTSEENVERAFKRLVMKWHPDNNPSNKEEARSMFKQISQAYDVLSNPQKRQFYDLHGQVPPPPSRASPSNPNSSFRFNPRNAHECFSEFVTGSNSTGGTNRVFGEKNNSDVDAGNHSSTSIPEEIFAKFFNEPDSGGPSRVFGEKKNSDGDVGNQSNSIKAEEIFAKFFGEPDSGGRNRVFGVKSNSHRVAGNQSNSIKPEEIFAQFFGEPDSGGTSHVFGHKKNSDGDDGNQSNSIKPEEIFAQFFGEPDSGGTNRVFGVKNNSHRDAGNQSNPSTPEEIFSKFFSGPDSGGRSHVFGEKRNSDGDDGNHSNPSAPEEFFSEFVTGSNSGGRGPVFREKRNSDGDVGNQFPRTAEDIFAQFFNGSNSGGRGPVFREKKNSDGDAGNHSNPRTPEEFFSEFVTGSNSGGRGPVFREKKNSDWDAGNHSNPKKPMTENKLQCSLEELYFGTTKRMKISRTIVDAFRNSRSKEEILDINIKAGWKKGTKITFPEKGNQKAGVIPGDIVFMIEEKPHEVYKRDGNDLVINQRISLLKALKGKKTLNLITLDGRNLMIPVTDFIRPGFEMVVPGEGMPISKEPGTKGNLRIKFESP